MGATRLHASRRGFKRERSAKARIRAHAHRRPPLFHHQPAAAPNVFGDTTAGCGGCAAGLYASASAHTEVLPVLDNNLIAIGSNTTLHAALTTSRETWLSTKETGWGRCKYTSKCAPVQPEAPSRDRQQGLAAHERTLQGIWVIHRSEYSIPLAQPQVSHCSQSPLQQCSQAALLWCAPGKGPGASWYCNCCFHSAATAYLPHRQLQCATAVCRNPVQSIDNFMSASRKLV